MMCYGSPAKSLEIARSRLTPEQWSRFEREFEDFCVVQGLDRDDWDLEHAGVFDWARWAFFQGRQLHLINNASVSNDRQTALAIAMMDDEQAVTSLERWEIVNLERGA